MILRGLNGGVSVPFSRALTSREEEDFKNTTNAAMNTLGVKNGIRLFKVFQTSLPSEEGENLGIGKLNSNKAMEYLKFNALYTGSNAVKIYPIGQVPSKLRFEHYYCPYERSATVIGEDNINFFKLTKKEYGNLLTDNDVKIYEIPDANNLVDYENELENSIGADSNLILKAYNNMQKVDTPEKVNIRAEFNEFKQSLKSDTMERLAITPFVKGSEPDLFLGIEKFTDKQDKFEYYKKKYEKEIDVFKFGKFLAQKNIKEAKEELNRNGLELYGDCPIGFSEDEVFCFPEAFYPKNITPGWGFRAINYSETYKSGTMANRLFTEKLKWHLENFDGIRFDVGWQYIQPNLQKVDDKGNTISQFSVDCGENIVKYIEKTAKEIKGEDFDTKKLLYEADGGPDEFQMFDWNGRIPTVKKIMHGRTAVLTDVFEHNRHFGWGNPDFYKRAGLNDYIIGTNNHDNIPLRALAENDDLYCRTKKVDVETIRNGNIDALSLSLRLDKNFINKPKNFVKAKFAELFQAKNHFLFFNDVVGNKERHEWHNPESYNYRYKIGNNYEKEYHSALQEHNGFNLAESLRIAMKAQHIDKTNPDLYQKIKHYSKVLYEKGAKTKEEAELQNNSRFDKFK